MPKKVIKGVTDLASQKPHLAKEWDFSKNEKLPDEVSQYSNKKAWWICSNNHSWEAIVANRSKGAGCPECAKTTRGENISKTKNKENRPLSDNRVLMEDFSILNSYDAYSEGNTYSSKILWVCSKCFKSWVARICKRIKGSGCPYCWQEHKGETYVKSIVNSKGSLFVTHPETEELWDYALNESHGIDSDNISAGSHSYAYWKCPKCSRSWRAIVKSIAVRGSRCSKCSQKISKGESELFSFVKGLFEDAIQNDREIIKPKELDIYIPSKKLAIEYNGEYWHSRDAFADRSETSPENYHRDKLNLCKDLGIRLLFVWEDDWLNNSELIKELIVDSALNNTDHEIFNRLISNRDCIL